MIDRTAILDDFDLPVRLVVDRLLQKTDGIHVLDLAPGAQTLTRFADRHVGVTAQAALLHITVARAEIAHDGAQLGDIGGCLGGRTHVRFGYDFH